MSMTTRMRIFYFLAVLILLKSPFAALAQTNSAEHMPLNTGFLSVGVGVGMTSLSGDLSQNQGIIFTSRFKMAYHGYLEKRFGKILGVSVNAMTGALSENQKSLQSNLNFETKIQQFGLQVGAHFDWHGEQYAAPFVMAGVSYLAFKPYTDLYNEQNKAYHYWSDGSIRDLPEFDNQGNYIQQNLIDSKIITRDYTYETALSKSFDSSQTVNYAQNTLAFPITIGVKLKLYEFLEGRLSATYNLTKSDFLDNYKAADNDAFLHGAFSLHYTIGKKYVHPKEKHYENVDFASIDKQDSDGDGVLDLYDQCANTKKGVPVDKQGCPEDKDKDGVADYKDKELDTKSGAHVDGMGRTITPEDFAKLDSIRKGVYVVRSARLNEAPSEQTLKELGFEIEEGIKDRGGAKSALPNKFLFADINDDGVIQASEITNAIDAFFSGEVDVTVTTIMEMIDYFFEQY